MPMQQTAIFFGYSPVDWKILDLSDILPTGMKCLIKFVVAHVDELEAIHTFRGGWVDQPSQRWPQFLQGAYVCRVGADVGLTGHTSTVWGVSDDDCTIKWKSDNVVQCIVSIDGFFPMEEGQ